MSDKFQDIESDIEFLYGLYLGNETPADYQLKSDNWRIKEIVGRIWADANMGVVKSLEVTTVEKPYPLGHLRNDGEIENHS